MDCQKHSWVGVEAAGDCVDGGRHGLPGTRHTEGWMGARVSNSPHPRTPEPPEPRNPTGATATVAE